jgi:hypothetical protein
MDEQTLQGLRERVDAKLRFAQVHLDELQALEHIGGNDFERAHQESFLYHLLGAKDAFLIELNVYYEAKLSEQGITTGKLKDALNKIGKESAELSELFILENQEDSWLFHAKVMRDHSTHVSSVPRVFYEGGERHQQVHLKNPKSGQVIERHFIDEYCNWLKNMEVLLERLRKSAIAKNGTIQ